MRELIGAVAGIALLLAVGSVCQEPRVTRALVPQECSEPSAVVQIGLLGDDGEVWTTGIFEQGAPLCFSAMNREVGARLRTRCLYAEGPSEWVAPVYGPVPECGG